MKQYDIRALLETLAALVFVAVCCVPMWFFARWLGPIGGQ